MVVRQYKAKGVVTETLLPVVALDDAVGLIVFAVSNSIALSLAQSAISAAGAVNATQMALSIAVWPFVEILASIAIGAGIGALLSLIPRFFKSRDNRTIATIIAVALSLGICELFSYLKDNFGCPFGLSDLLVCMMAGATFVNMRKEATQMMESTDRWTPVVLMLFFILFGSGTQRSHVCRLERNSVSCYISCSSLLRKVFRHYGGRGDYENRQKSA